MMHGETVKIKRPVVRYHGGKWKLAKWIISHFPEHRIYVEPYCGGASVLLQKERCYCECVNDMNDEMVNLFRVLRNRDTAADYCDPPYVAETRDKGSDYSHEMTSDDHRQMAKTLRALTGKVIVSGYPCDLYDKELFADWHRVERPYFADGARKRTEVLWMNFKPELAEDNAPQNQLFEEHV